MFETAEVGHSLDAKRYEEIVPELRERLLDAQHRLVTEREFSVLVIVAGVDGAGKGDTINLLHGWLDTHYMRTTGIGTPTDEERMRPPLWRFWRILPPKGEIGVFMGSWYTEPIIDRAFRRSTDVDLDKALGRIRRFERMLSREGVVLIKLWFHLSKDEQKKRLEKLESKKRTRWRVTEQDWKHFEMYDRFRTISAHSLRRTSTDFAPWLIVPGAEPRYRQVVVGQALLEALERGHEGRTKPAPPVLPPAVPTIDGKTVITCMDLTKELPKKPYREELEKQQGRLNLLTRDPRFAERSLVLVFEGVDAAGKGGAIRRVTAGLDARQYYVVPIAAPTDEELAQPYLWRFWRQLPADRKIAIFDRSWYGRVLVERVERFAADSEWMRAYDEINDFEEQLVESGTTVVKLWLQIDPQEQLARFRERQRKSFKQYKITEEDWRNRDKWDEYQRTASEMIERTSTEIAPWTLVEANDKRFARIKVLRTINDALEAALDLPIGKSALNGKPKRKKKKRRKK